jgi:hypothetical protein
MKKMTAAMCLCAGGTSGCGCAARLPIESDRGLPGYSLLQVTFTCSHHSFLNRLSHVLCQPSRTRCLRMVSPRPERVDRMRTMIGDGGDGDGISGLVDGAQRCQQCSRWRRQKEVGMTATEPAVSWMTWNDCGRVAVGVRNSVVSALDGAERCRRCSRWCRTVPEVR